MVCSCLVSLDVALRFIFNHKGFHSFEITEFATAFVVSISFADALIQKQNIRIDVLYSKFPVGVKSLLDIAAMAAIALLVCLIAYWGAQVAIESYDFGSTSKSTFAFPMYIPQGLWALGLTWFAIVAVVLLVTNLLRLVQGKAKEVNRAIGAVDTVKEELEHALQAEEEAEALQIEHDSVRGSFDEGGGDKK